jgi:AraC family transcriptional regulator
MNEPSASLARPARTASALSSIKYFALPMAKASAPLHHEMRDGYVPQPQVAIALAGRGKRRFTYGLGSRDLYTAPGMIELYPAGFHVSRAAWSNSERGDVVLIEFPATTVEALLGSGQAFQLPVRHELFDARILTLVQMLWNEESAEAKLGGLYSQGLALSLISLLHEHGTVRGAQGAARSIFSPRERSELTEFVDCNLSAAMSIEQLASLVSMSPDRFARGFRASFGQPPYAYVLERRIQAACRQLSGSLDGSLSEVALACGFANQSHFTETFRRKTGTTPGRWRDESRRRGVGVTDARKADFRE